MGEDLEHLIPDRLGEVLRVDVFLVDRQQVLRHLLVNLVQILHHEQFNDEDVPLHETHVGLRVLVFGCVDQSHTEGLDPLGELLRV